MSKIYKNVAAAVSVAICLIQPLFFSVLGLLGLDYQGAEESNLFVFYAIICFSLICVFYIRCCVRYGFYVKELVLLCFFFAVLFFHILSAATATYSLEVFPHFMMLFVVFGLSGYLAAAVVFKGNIADLFNKYLELAAILVSLGVLFYSLIPAYTGQSGERFGSLAGASYQALSYYSAISFGLLLYFNYLCPSNYRFFVLKSRMFFLISHLFIIVSAAGVMLGGGRGAFLLMLVYILFTVAVMVVRSGTFSAMIKTLSKLFLLFVTAVVFVIFLGDHDLVTNGLMRFAQILNNEGGLDLARGGSGRDVVYSTAILGMLERPFFGYGPFYVHEMVIHPHNIVIEMLLQFGMVFGGLLVCVLLLTYLRSLICVFYEKYLFVLLVGIYPAVNLMFSSSYMHSSSFWFYVAGVIAFGSHFKGNNSHLPGGLYSDDI